MLWNPSKLKSRGTFIKYPQRLSTVDAVLTSFYDSQSFWTTYNVHKFPMDFWYTILPFFNSVLYTIRVTFTGHMLGSPGNRDFYRPCVLNCPLYFGSWMPYLTNLDWQPSPPCYSMESHVGSLAYPTWTGPHYLLFLVPCQEPLCWRRSPLSQTFWLPEEQNWVNKIGNL